MNGIQEIDDLEKEKARIEKKLSSYGLILVICLLFISVASFLLAFKKSATLLVICMIIAISLFYVLLHYFTFKKNLDLINKSMQLYNEKGLLQDSCNQLREELKLKKGRNEERKSLKSSFKATVDEKAKAKILSFLRAVQEKDKYLLEGYAVRLVKYYYALHSKLCYIDSSIATYADYFFPYSEKRNRLSYHKTFTNTFNNLSMTQEEIDMTINEIRSLMK